MFAKIDVSKVTKMVFLKESIDKSYLLRFYDVYLEDGSIENLLYFLSSKEDGFLISGCSLSLDRNDELSRSEPLKYEDAFYLAHKFELFPLLQNMQDNEVVFICRKCNHHLLVSDISLDKLSFVSVYDCPNCGEEGHKNWILSHIANSQKEKDLYDWK